MAKHRHSWGAAVLTVLVVDGDEETEIPQHVFNFVAEEFHAFLEDPASYLDILVAAVVLHECCVVT